MSEFEDNYLIYKYISDKIVETERIFSLAEHSISMEVMIIEKACQNSMYL